MVIKNNEFQNPMKHDAVLLFKNFGNNYFTIEDIKREKIDLECNIRKLLVRRIVTKVSRIKYGSWVYKLNPSLIVSIKQQGQPLIGKV